MDNITYLFWIFLKENLSEDYNLWNNSIFDTFKLWNLENKFTNLIQILGGFRNEKYFFIIS